MRYWLVLAVAFALRATSAQSVSPGEVPLSFDSSAGEATAGRFTVNVESAPHGYLYSAKASAGTAATAGHASRGSSQSQYAITSITPAVAAAGGPGFTLAVKGSFGAPITVGPFTQPGSTLLWNGAPRPTTLLSASTLIASIPASDIASPGTTQVSVLTYGEISNSVTFTISPPGTDRCEYSLAPPSLDFPSIGGALTTTITAPSGCDWTVTNDTSWIAVESAASGSGSATVVLSAPGYGGVESRIGIVVIGGQVLTVTQPGPILFSLSPATVTAGDPAFTLTVGGAGFQQYVIYGSGGGPPGTLLGVDGWNIFNTIVANPGRLTVEIPAEFVARPRALLVTASTFPTGGTSNPLVLTVLPPGCTYSISPSQLTVPVSAGRATIDVTATQDCAWDVTATVNWIQPAAATGSGTGSVALAYLANPARYRHRGTVVIGGQTFTLTQEGSDPLPAFAAAAVSNAASMRSGATAGGLVSIFGRNLTKDISTKILVAGAPPWPAELAGTSVEFDGIAAPLLALADVKPDGVEQINVQVPFELAGRDSVQVVVRNNGLSSAPVPVALVPADPGIFVSDGLGIVLHASTGRLVTLAEPAAGGEIVEIYATGLGAVTPPVPSGVAAPSVPLSLTIASPVVTIGSVNAEVLLSGLVPGSVGVYKVAVRVPEAIPVDGTFCMTVAVAGRSSPPVSIPIADSALALLLAAS